MSSSGDKGVLARLRALRRGVRRAAPAPEPVDYAGPRLLAAFAAANPEAVFVEIGSNDGARFDHLRPHILAQRWRGVMVEPVPYVFARLRRNYEGIDRVALENVVISDRDGSVPFYYLRPASASDGELPDWYDAIGSLSREAVLAQGHAIPEIERQIEEAELPSLSFESLCRKHAIERLDLLLIDTEGYDYEVIKGVDFGAHRPRLLVYEHLHLSSPDRAECQALLGRLGYETMEEGFDTWCLDTRVADSITECWRGLSPAVASLPVEQWR